MRLSEAIRLGATLHPQAFDELRVMWPEPPRLAIPWGGPTGIHSTCALGAAGLAIGEEWTDNYDYKVRSAQFPILGKTVTSPVDGAPDDLDSMIMGLNDDEKWSRERIADWVEQVEREQEDAQVQAELASVCASV